MQIGVRVGYKWVTVKGCKFEPKTLVVLSSELEDSYPNFGTNFLQIYKFYKNLFISFILRVNTGLSKGTIIR